MSATSSLAVLFDVDNTLLDSDRVIDDFRRHLATAFGEDQQKHYWSIFEEIQAKLGYADYLAHARYRCDNPKDPNFLKLSLYLLDYPFAERLFPKALDVVAFFKKRGVVAIVSDGDVVFQPRKIERSGLYERSRGACWLYQQGAGPGRRRTPLPRGPLISFSTTNRESSPPPSTTGKTA